MLTFCASRKCAKPCGLDLFSPKPLARLITRHRPLGAPRRDGRACRLWAPMGAASAAFKLWQASCLARVRVDTLSPFLDFLAVMVYLARVRVSFFLSPWWPVAALRDNRPNHKTATESRRLCHLRNRPSLLDCGPVWGHTFTSGKRRDSQPPLSQTF